MGRKGVRRPARISIRLPAPVFERLAAHAATEGCSITHVIEHILCDALEITAPVNGHPLPAAFTGEVITVDTTTFAAWQKKYKEIPDLSAALQYADDFLRTHPDMARNWRGVVENYLTQENKGVEAEC